MKPMPLAVERYGRRQAKRRAWLAVRKQVLERDKGKCRACGTGGEVDVHHKKLRSAGGGDTTDNLLCLCRCCHALVHAYRLFIHGDSADGALRFERVA